MNINQKKGMASFFVGCMSIGVLSGCGSKAVDTQEHGTNTTIAPSDNAMEIVKNDALAVDQKKCIGCGKCVRTASANFAMDQNTRKATVISQEVTSQATVSRAVEMCPTKAITQ
jgi:ferredoxin